MTLARAERAQRAKARISHVNGSHPSMVEHPEATVAAITTALNFVQGPMPAMR